MKTFLLIWFGQLISQIGTTLTRFALLVWLYLQTGSVMDVIGHLYAAQMLAGVFESFQSPAYAAATTLLVPKEAYGRVNGLRSLAQSGAMVIAPFSPASSCFGWGWRASC